MRLYLRPIYPSARAAWHHWALSGTVGHCLWVHAAYNVYVHAPGHGGVFGAGSVLVSPIKSELWEHLARQEANIPLRRIEPGPHDWRKGHAWVKPARQADCCILCTSMMTNGESPLSPVGADRKSQVEQEIGGQTYTDFLELMVKQVAAEFRNDVADLRRLRKLVTSQKKITNVHELRALGLHRAHRVLEGGLEGGRAGTGAGTETVSRSRPGVGDMGKFSGDSSFREGRHKFGTEAGTKVGTEAGSGTIEDGEVDRGRSGNRSHHMLPSIDSSADPFTEAAATGPGSMGGKDGVDVLDTRLLPASLRFRSEGKGGTSADLAAATEAIAKLRAPSKQIPSWHTRERPYSSQQLTPYLKDNVLEDLAIPQHNPGQQTGSIFNPQHPFPEKPMTPVKLAGKNAKQEPAKYVALKLAEHVRLY